LVICGSPGCQAARAYSLIRAPRKGFSVDQFAVEVDNSDAVTVVFAIGDALRDTQVRQGRIFAIPRCGKAV